MALKPYRNFFLLITIAAMALGSKKYRPHFKHPEAIKIVADNVRHYRNVSGISMEKLADIIGIEYTVISRLELKKSNPSISLVYAIAQALSIEPEKLFIKR